MSTKNKYLPNKYPLDEATINRIREARHKIDEKDPGKYREAFRRLTMLKPFQEWVSEIRAKAGIPPDGMSFKDSDNPNEDEEFNWAFSKDPEIKRKEKIINGAVKAFCKKHILGGFDPLDIWQTAIHDYVLNAKPSFWSLGGSSFVDDYYYGCEWVQKDTNLKELKKLNHACIGLFIFPYAKQKDVIRFIKRHWDVLEMFNHDGAWKGKHWLGSGKNPRTGKIVRKIKSTTLEDFLRLGQIGYTSLFSMRRKKKANEHEKIYQLYKTGVINSYGITDPKKAPSLRELNIKYSPDNVRKIIYTQKKLHGEMRK